MHRNERQAAAHASRSEVLSSVKTLCDEGRYLEALAIVEPLGDLAKLQNPDEVTLAARLIGHLGAMRTAQAMNLRTLRRHPDHRGLRYYASFAMLERDGPWATWLMFRQRPELFETDEQQPSPLFSATRADWLAARARLLAILRDFTAAERDIQAALALAPEHAWLRVELSAVRMLQDRHEEAVEAAREALRMRPSYPAAVSATAGMLTTLGRIDEAMELLESATQRLQSGAVHWHIAALLRERREFARADESLLKARQMLPLMDRSTRSRWCAMRSDLLYELDDLAGAAALAREAADLMPPMAGELLRKIADRMSRPEPDRRRKLLDVPFVRQHHRTCAPATLASIARYWNRPAEHVEIADAICYDGTPWHNERRWAEDQGYELREFRVSFDAAADLVDRGVPFTFTTVEAASAHLQAIAGYDRTQETLRIRDPSTPHIIDMDAAALDDHYAAYGPRGLAFVPKEEAARLKGLSLPDEESFNAYHRLHRALMEHRRDEAEAIESQWRQRAPEDRLTLWMSLSLAEYDADPVRGLAAVEALLARFPEHGHLLMRRLTFLEQLGRRSEHLRALEELEARPKTDPVFRERLAFALAEDHRQDRRTRRLLRKLLRQRPTEATLYYTLGRVLWSDADQRPLAFDAYRFASTLADRNEQFADAYFVVQQHARKTEEALESLRQRAEQLGAKSAGPAITYFNALCRVGRFDRAMAALDAAIARKPDDPDLLLIAAAEHGARRNLEEAQRRLAQAESMAHRNAWLRTACDVDRHAGWLLRALAHAQELAEREPLSSDAQGRVCELLNQLHGPEAACGHLQEVCARFPHHAGLRSLLYQWLREEDPGAAELTLREAIELHPTNAWAVRELGFLLAGQGRWDEARRELETATELEPDAGARFHLVAMIEEHAGNEAAARDALWQALEDDADDVLAIRRLLELTPEPDKRREAAQRIAAHVSAKMFSGDGAAALQDAGRLALEPAAVLEAIQRCRTNRRDLWKVRAALVRQLLEMSKLDEALREVSQAVEEFPLVAALWVDKALVHRARLEQQEMRVSLLEALRVEPNYPYAISLLVEFYAARQQLDEAMAVVDAAMAREPRNPEHGSWRARLLWLADKQQEALAQAESVLDQFPRAELWPLYAFWCERTQQRNRPAALARKLIGERPGDSHLRLQLARLLTHPTEYPEALASLDEAIRLQPRLTDAHDARAQSLAMMGRLDEAQRACRPAAYGDRPPFTLRGREAWVLALMGRMREAVAAMEKVVADEPAYYWGWYQLAHWSRALKDQNLLRRATARLSELAPHDEQTIAFAAGLLLEEAETEKNEKARERLQDQAQRQLEHAVALNPVSVDASARLFALLLARGSLDRAQELCETNLAPNLFDDAAAATRVRLWAARQDRERLLDALRQLAQVRSEDFDSAMSCVHAVRHFYPWAAGSAKKLMRSADPHMGNLMAIAAAAAWQALDGQFHRALWTLRKLKKHPLAWQRGVTEVLTQIANYSNYRGVAIRFVKRNRKRFAATGHEPADAAWAQAGSVMWLSGRPEVTARLLEDYKKRTHLQQWMLVDFAGALHDLGRFDEARALSEAALALASDHTLPRHLVWYALVLLRDNQPEKASECLGRVTAEELPQYYQGLLETARALLIAATTENAHNAHQWALARIRAGRSHLISWPASRAFRRWLALAYKRAGSRVGGMKAWEGRVQALLVRMGGK